MPQVSPLHRTILLSHRVIPTTAREYSSNTGRTERDRERERGTVLQRRRRRRPPATQGEEQPTDRIPAHLLTATTQATFFSFFSFALGVHSS